MSLMKFGTFAVSEFFSDSVYIVAPVCKKWLSL